MSDLAAMILRFEGDPDDLLQRYQTARGRWLETRDPDCDPPTLHAILRAKDAIVIINGCANSEQAHQFGRAMGACMKQAGLRPAGHERFRIEKLGWD